MCKIGIFGGSFNPIHNGHIFVAEKVKEMLGLDTVIFIPTGIAPHKDNSDFASKEHRYNMVKLAIDGRFDISDIEVKTNKVCYAVDTMAEIKKIYPDDDLYYIIGADSLIDFMTWKEPLKLFKMLHLVVVDREDADIEKCADEYRNKYDAKITICHIGKYDVSSTHIRELIKKTGTCKDYVPEETEKYIIKHRLYTEV
ncbi:MAG: nicotinate-nucleotide adenylyltransferase [Clostridia bacterium]|nr:nicotinate-nucleotide adenylyltransferase [Clostridia bacterium]